MTTESETPERISLDEFDGLRSHLHNIEAQANRLVGLAHRLKLAVDDLTMRPEWKNASEDGINMAYGVLRDALSSVSDAIDEVHRVRASYQAKPPFV